MIINTNTTCVAISPTVAATNDLAGFTAISDFVVFDNFRMIDDHVETRKITKVLNLCTGEYDIITGAIDHDDMKATLGFDPTDAAQVSADGLFSTGATVTLREIDSVGNTFYYTATIASRSRGRAEGDEVKRAYTFKIAGYAMKPA